MPTQLAALTIVSPSFPANSTTLSVATSLLPLVIDADTNTIAVDVVLGADATPTTLTAFTLVNGLNQFTGTVPVSSSTDPQTVSIVGRNYSSTVTPATPLTTPTIQFDLLYSATRLGFSIGPPSGVTVYKSQNTCQVEWAIPTYSGFQGVRVQWSTDPSGVTVPFVQIGGLQTELTRSADVTVVAPVASTASVAQPIVPGLAPTNLVTTTSVETTVTVDYSSLTIPSSTVNTDVFYVILSSLMQDPVTNQVYESQDAGPFLCGFVNLKKVNPTDFLALQQSSDIATRLITEVTRRRPDLDLTARAEIRDLIINPLSLELANMSVREWFSRCAISISAISQIDDANGDGISDPVASSAVKQQIARAYGLSATAVQTFIDGRFDILGEQAGVERGGATAAVVPLTFYVYSLPTSLITIPAGIICSTLPNGVDTAAVSFVTQGSATIDPTNASAYYSPSFGWWGVTVPAQAQVAGAASTVGAETIRQVSTGGPSGISVINLTASYDGTDEQANADYAAMIQNRLVAGKDSGTRNGYWNTTMSIPGITNALVVAAGDLDMLRDWSSIIARHTYGCVDIYARGTTLSQQTEEVPFTLPATSTYGVYSTYLNAVLADKTKPSFKILDFAALTQPLYSLVEMTVSYAGQTIWLGTTNAQIDNSGGQLFLNPNDLTYVINADGTITLWQINGVNATNLAFIQALSAVPATYAFLAQYQSGITHTPILQPVDAVDSITGNLSGAIPAADIELVYTNDFLLTGGSNNAGDLVTVGGALSSIVTNTLTLATATTVIDSNMNIGVNSAGQLQNILSVRSADLSTVYTFGLDYTLVAAGRYHTYALQVLNDQTGAPRIPLGTNTVIVAYYRFLLRESVTLQTDNLTLSGSTPTPLSHGGFIYNSWLPASHGDTTLLLDGYVSPTLAYTGLLGAGVPAASRYIKVTYNNGVAAVVMIEGKDFTLSVDPVTGNAALTRVLGGSLPDGGAVTVLYFTAEVFTIQTEYPAYVQELVSAVAGMKHAGADVLVKAMVASAVDVTMNVVLSSTATADAVDGTIRTVISNVIDSSTVGLFQSELISQVQGILGITNVVLPLLKCAKADGSYDIGVVIPTGTPWVKLSADTLFQPLLPNASAFISAAVIVPNPTIPSGGPPNTYVGWLYEGQSYRRALSVQDFLGSSGPSFYIIGANDSINAALPIPSVYEGRVLLYTPSTVPDPSALPYRLTYQIFGAASADDISTASCEYLVTGAVQINYVAGG